jgi:hypothetical protein
MTVGLLTLDSVGSFHRDVGTVPETNCTVYVVCTYHNTFCEGLSTYDFQFQIYPFVTLVGQKSFMFLVCCIDLF